METSAFVMGIISLIVTFGGAPTGFGWIGTICGILAIVFGAVGKSKNTENKGMAQAGFVMGIISLFGSIIICIVVVILALVFGVTLFSFLNI